MSVADNNFQDFVVYMHESPECKKYIGITCQSLDSRSGHNGCNYFYNKLFKQDIEKFGWDAFNHIILESGLDYLAANDREQHYIRKFNTTDPLYGYNLSPGGDSKMFSPQTRCKMSEVRKHLCQTTDIMRKISKSLKGHTVSPETRSKISLSKRGRLLGHTSPLKGRKFSLQHRQKLQGRTPWNKGLTKDTDDRVKKQSDAIRGISKSAEHRLKLSVAAKNRYSDIDENLIWVNNGKQETIIRSSDLSSSKYKDFVPGRLDKDYVYIYKNDISRRVPAIEVSSYISDGWAVGRGKKVSEVFKKVNSRFTWVYDNQEFSSAEDLATYLRSHGYPDIVSSTITAKYRENSWSKTKKYQSLEGKINRYSNEVHV